MKVAPKNGTVTGPFDIHIFLAIGISASPNFTAPAVTHGSFRTSPVARRPATPCLACSSLASRARKLADGASGSTSAGDERRCSISNWEVLMKFTAIALALLASTATASFAQTAKISTPALSFTPIRLTPARIAMAATAETGFSQSGPPSASVSRYPQTHSTLS